MMTIDEASCDVLKYLDKIWGSISSSGSSIMHVIIFLTLLPCKKLLT